MVAKRSCYDCVYAWFDAERWLRDLFAGRTLVPMCANPPQGAGELYVFRERRRDVGTDSSVG